MEKTRVQSREQKKRLRKAERKAHNKDRWVWRGKKALVAAVVFLFFIGLAAVDGSYAALMQRDGALTLQVRRLDERNIRVSCFGMTREVDLVELRTLWEERLTEAKKELDHKIFGTLTV